MRRIFFGITIGVVFILGIVIGGYVFSHTQPRSVITVANCTTNCFNTAQLKGLLVSLDIQDVPALLPPIIKETDDVLVIDSPEPEAKIDYLILPKKDITDLGELTSDDRKYIDDTFLVIAELIQEQHLTNYQVVTNGPGRQKLNYLHFHLLSN